MIFGHCECPLVVTTHQIEKKAISKCGEKTMSVFSPFPIVIEGENAELQMSFACLTSSF